jgi:hypothetical protein
VLIVFFVLYSVWGNVPPSETCMIVKCIVADIGETRGHVTRVFTSRERTGEMMKMHRLRERGKSQRKREVELFLLGIAVLLHNPHA